MDRWRFLAAGLLSAALLAAPASVATGAPTSSASGVAPPTSRLVTADLREEEVTVPVRAEPDGTEVTLDATIVSPLGTEQHPAVVLAHGFGGSKADLLERARELAAHGYVALAYTARGFGASGGRIHLDDPDYEIADGTAMVDLLAGRPEVQRDADGDPRVGVAGGSYGGALALMLAGIDRRVDAVVAAITWNDLATSLLPGRTGGNDGVLKRRWASVLYASAVGRGSAAAPTDVCGRFDPTVCRVFLEAADTGVASPMMEQILRRNSPAPLLHAVRAPTLLVQGMRDSLFGLDQASATARTLSAQGVPVAVRWFDGGHDGGTAPADADTLLPWLDRYLTDSGRAAAAAPGAAATPMPLPAFSAPIPVTGGDRDVTMTLPPALEPVRLGTSPAGVAPPDVHRVPLSRVPALPSDAASDAPSDTSSDAATDSASGVPSESRPAASDATSTPGPSGSPAAAPPDARLLSPPGGDPSAITNTGGFGGANAPGSGGSAGPSGSAGAAGYALAALPGQHVAFDTAELTDREDVVGAPRVRLRVTSTTSDATLFASLWRITPAGPVSPRGQVVPVRVSTTPGVPVEVDLPLPAGTYSMAKGARWRVLVSATDAGYAVPADARFYTVGLADPALRLPTTSALTAPDAANASSGLAPVSSLDREVVGAAAALLALLVLIGLSALFTAARRRRLDRRDTRVEDADVPLVVDGLVKTYKDGHRAVDDVSWRAEAGQVVGLLGPNGAGKTTTMRMLVGLIRPDSGAVHVLGQPVHAGSAVLRRVGALIEGPGFLPHLTGRQNLHAYWEATGRDPADAHVEAALEVAALGDAVDRPVRTYSQGMRQRLGIAQAMLGRPDVLLLDEPTNGLDPPQIAAMRPILRDYARSGRTVVVSSHLLAEVEQTCTHVVVMNRGRVIATGSVADLVTGDGTTVVTLGPACDPKGVADALRSGPLGERLRRVRLDATARTLTVVGDAPRGEIVAAAVAAGADIESVVARRRLEEVFLGVIDEDALTGAVGSSSTTRGAGVGHRDAARDGEAADPDGESSSADPPADDPADDDPSDDEEGRMDRLRQVRSR